MQADAAACTEQLAGDYPFCIHVYRGWYVCRAGTAGGKAIEFFVVIESGMHEEGSFARRIKVAFSELFTDWGTFLGIRSIG